MLLYCSVKGIIPGHQLLVRSGASGLPVYGSGVGESAVNMNLRVHEHFKGGAHKCGITRALVMPHL